jgi:hypothetical protein
MNDIKGSYYVVDYQHIDDYRCFRPLGEGIEQAPFTEPIASEVRQEVEQLRAELGELFRNAGWEGDGTIECFFIPPCFCNRGDTSCEIIYHVKQSNNGTSWLAIPHGFRFEMPQGFLSQSTSNI